MAIGIVVHLRVSIDDIYACRTLAISSSLSFSRFIYIAAAAVIVLRLLLVPSGWQLAVLSTATTNNSPYKVVMRFRTRSQVL
jgi:hypothetical protein